MKKFTLLFVVIFLSFTAKSQCDEKVINEAKSKLETSIYVKDFKVKLKTVTTTKDIKYMTYPIMLNKGVRYKFVLADDKAFEGRLIFELANDRGRQLSSYIPEIKKHFAVLEYSCNASGMYFVNLEFENAKEGCGVLMYGVKNN